MIIFASYQLKQYTMKTLTIIFFFFLYNFSISQKLEAIMILGHVDNKNRNNDTIKGSTYQKFLIDIEKEAAFLESKGVIVHKFYGDNAKWKDIIKVSPNCSFFIYAGHGNDGGHLALSPEKYTINKKYTEYDIIDTLRINELKLKKNSLVIMNHACTAAGSSATDKTVITKEKAIERTEAYINFFINSGASAYFATNTSGGVYDVLAYLYSGNNLISFVNGTGLGYCEKEELNIYYKKSKDIKYILYSTFVGIKNYGFDLCICANPNFSLNKIREK